MMEKAQIQQKIGVTNNVIEARRQAERPWEKHQVGNFVAKNTLSLFWPHILLRSPSN
jgi:hypothetical protein